MACHAICLLAPYAAWKPQFVSRYFAYRHPFFTSIALFCLAGIGISLCCATMDAKLGDLTSPHLTSPHLTSSQLYLYSPPHSLR